MSRILPLAVTLLSLVPAIRLAHADTAGPMGLWDRDDARGGVRISRCGAALCGRVTWLRDPKGPGHIGETVFYAMRQTGPDTWSGMAHNPEDGHDYSGTLSLSGGRMIVKGCALGGLVCRSMGLSRH